MGKRREELTLDQIKEQVQKEIPYVVGRGREVIDKRTKRQKELMRRHGMETERPFIGISRTASGSRQGARYDYGRSQSS